MSSIKKEIQYRVGALAAAGNVGLGTIRHYQKLGLLNRPPRPKNGGARSYAPKDLEQLLMIRNTQGLGFSLKEIGEILLHRERDDCQSVKRLFAEKNRVLQQLIRSHEAKLQSLKQLADSCREECAVGECQFFKNLVALDLQWIA
jgi:MerR family mercuric resistance operon transcriptional regulator